MNDNTSASELLKEVTQLSHEFGTNEYVCGGGGNTSAKDEHTLWIKPSGTTLSTIKPESFLAMNRSILSKMYEIQIPDDSQQGEQLVTKTMQQALVEKSSKRASVEAPLHNLLPARYVVHTHPAIVNAMTCARDGGKVCHRLFPDALWLDFIKPGYTLCMQVHREILEYQKQKGRKPSVIFLKNHGVFVTADTPEEIRNIHTYISQALLDEYRKTGIPTSLAIGSEPDAKSTSQAIQQIQSVMGKDNAPHICSSGYFDLANGPVSPDHIVYAKSFPLIAEPTASSLSKYENEHGYLPQIIAWKDAIYAIGNTETKAALALEISKDGALVKQLAEAFGAIEYMSDPDRKFIENWEAEVYRSQQI